MKFDDSGKFILKIKDFKDIFDGIVDFIPKHQEFLSNLRKAPGIDNFLIALNELVKTVFVPIWLFILMFRQILKVFMLINHISRHMKKESPH